MRNTDVSFIGREVEGLDVGVETLFVPCTERRRLFELLTKYSPGRVYCGAGDRPGITVAQAADIAVYWRNLSAVGRACFRVVVEVSPVDAFKHSFAMVTLLRSELPLTVVFVQEREAPVQVAVKHIVGTRLAWSQNGTTVCVDTEAAAYGTDRPV